MECSVDISVTCGVLLWKCDNHLKVWLQDRQKDGKTDRCRTNEIFVYWYCIVKTEKSINPSIKIYLVEACTDMDKLIWYDDKFIFQSPSDNRVWLFFSHMSDPKMYFSCAKVVKRQNKALQHWHLSVMVCDVIITCKTDYVACHPPTVVDRFGYLSKWLCEYGRKRNFYVQLCFRVDTKIMWLMGNFFVIRIQMHSPLFGGYLGFLPPPTKAR